MRRFALFCCLILPSASVAETIVIDGARSIRVGAYLLVLNGQSATIDTETKRITIGPAQPGPGPNPIPPDPPRPDLSDLGRAAHDWTRAVNRPASEKRAFAKAYSRTASAIRSAEAAGVQFTAAQCVKMLADEVGALATPDFRSAWGKWNDAYRVQMRELRLTTAEQHADAWDDIAAGIEASIDG